MIRVNLSDGRTLSFDLDKQIADWERLQSDPVRQRELRAAAVQINGTAAAVTSPRGFREIAHSAESIVDSGGKKVGERLTVQADDVRLDVLLYEGQSRVRIGLTRTGRPRYLKQFDRRDLNGNSN